MVTITLLNRVHDGNSTALPRPMTVRYRLQRRIFGMYDGEAHPITIPVGAIVEMPHTRSKVGIVGVLYDDRVVRVFLHDLLHAGRVESDGSVG